MAATMDGTVRRATAAALLTVVMVACGDGGTGTGDGRHLLGGQRHRCSRCLDHASGDDRGEPHHHTDPQRR